MWKTRFRKKSSFFLSEKFSWRKGKRKYLLKEVNILISLTGTVNKTDYGNISWSRIKNNKILT